MTGPPVEPKYRDRDTERFASGEHVRRLQGVPLRAAVKALDRLDAATQLFDLMTPRSNRFEALKGDRRGQYSIRINMQWRVCFEWSDEQHEPFNIEIVDYHD
jgi:toxin HigB-1